MTRRSLGTLLLGLAARRAQARAADLQTALAAVAPGLPKWACLCIVHGPTAAPRFEWHDYRDTADRRDFWPASTIKLYAAIAALEQLHALGLPAQTRARFEHRQARGAWRFDVERPVDRLISEVFRRSANEDYTLLLRLSGLDRINTRFLTPERGFPGSALMRGYVKERPWAYVREEAQRIELIHDAQSHTVEHSWSGRFYAEERGASVIDARTGNVTSPRELVDCLRRVLFHEALPEAERFRISPAMLTLLRHGSTGLSGLETAHTNSGPSSWTPAVQAAFPGARYFHKSGLISNCALDLAAIDARAQGGPCVLWLLGIRAGHATEPKGEPLVGRMAEAVVRWLAALPC